jgi:hypothetical protein
MRVLMVKGNLFMYSSLHIFYVLFQCNIDITSLNNYLLYVKQSIVTMSSSRLINVQCILLLLVLKHKNYIIFWVVK